MSSDHRKILRGIGELEEKIEQLMLKEVKVENHIPGFCPSEHCQLAGFEAQLKDLKREILFVKKKLQQDKFTLKRVQKEFTAIREGAQDTLASFRELERALHSIKENGFYVDQEEYGLEGEDE